MSRSDTLRVQLRQRAAAAARFIREPSVYKRPLQSISVLWLGTFLGSGLGFLTQVILARVLGVEQFGSFSAAYALTMLLAPLAGFGIAGYWLKVFGREGWTGTRWIAGSMRFLMFSTTLVLAMLVGWAWAGPHDQFTTWLLTILAVHVLGQAALALASAKYQLEGRHTRQAAWQFTPHFLRFIGIGALALLLGHEALIAPLAAAVFAAVALLMVAVGGYQIMLMQRGRFALEGHGNRPQDDDTLAQEARPGAFRIAAGAWPFGLAGVFYLVYFQSDIILVKYLVDDAAAGIYNVAFAVMAAIYLFPSVVFQKFLLPRLHRWAYQDKAKLHQSYRYGNVVMLVQGFAAMICLWLLAPPLVPWLFGTDYREAVELLMILAVAAPFRFLATSAGAPLATGGNMRLKVKLMAITALANVMLNILLIPSYGIFGAAVATVLSDIALCLMYLKSYRDKFIINSISVVTHGKS